MTSMRIFERRLLIRLPAHQDILGQNGYVWLRGMGFTVTRTSDHFLCHFFIDNSLCTYTVTIAGFEGRTQSHSNSRSTVCCSPHDGNDGRTSWLKIESEILLLPL